MPPDVVLDASGRIDEDVSCRVCSYNLRGGDPEGVCPECGTAVGWSLVGDLLKFADPDWVRKLATGLTWLLIAIIGGFIVGLAAGLAASAIGSAGGKLLILGVQILTAGASAVGYWLFTEPEPVEKFGEPVRVRLWARWGCVLSVILGFTGGIVRMADPVTSSVIGIAAQIVGIVGFITLFVYARRLALRIPDLNLARQTRIVMWGLVVLMGLGILIWIVMAITMPSQVSGPGNTGGPSVSMAGGAAAFGCVLVLGYLIFGIWALVLLVMYRNRFTKQAEQARRTWAARQPVS